MSIFMRHLEGEFASQYNRRKQRRGTFWSERYHSTPVEDGPHFWNCMRYIDLNMVRAGVVHHPRDWPWCGYQEISGLWCRYRVLDLDDLLRRGGLTDPGSFTERYSSELERVLQAGELRREAHWTEGIAVGSETFVRRIAALAKNRKKLEIKEWTDAGWNVRDPAACYGRRMGAKSTPRDKAQASAWKNSFNFWRQDPAEKGDFTVSRLFSSSWRRQSPLFISPIWAPFNPMFPGVSLFRTPELKSMNRNLPPLSLTRRLAYSFVGLLAGDIVLLVFLLLNALQVTAWLFAARMGEPTHMIPVTLQVFVIYAIFSFVGWLFIGLPTVLLLPVRTITRLSWPLRLLVGAALGPLALLAIFVLLGHGHVDFPASFTGTGALWDYSVVVSTVCFVVYAALLRKHLSS